MAGSIGFSTDPRIAVPCEVGGRMFVCGTSLAFDGRRFVDSGTTMPFDAAGHFPDAVWSFGYEDKLPYKTLQHWNATAKAWRTLPGLAVHAPGFAGEELIARAWWPGRVLVVEQAPDEKKIEAGSDQERVWIQSYGTGSSHPLPSLKVRNGGSVMNAITSVAGFVTGEVVAVGSKGPDSHTASAVWRPNATKPEIYPVGDGKCEASRHLAAFAPSDIVMVGGRDFEHPCAFHFDGHGWSSYVLPTWGTEAVDYAREPGGTEWVVMVAHEWDTAKPAPPLLSVWRRAPGAEWSRVGLPLPLADLGVDLPGHDLPRGRVWAVADGDVWVSVTFADRCGQRAFALLRTKPGPHACRMRLGQANLCPPMGAQEPVDTRACTPAHYAR